MINRINIFTKMNDSRNRNCKTIFNNFLNKKNKINNLFLISSYIIDIDINREETIKIGESLTNKRIENYLINELPYLEKFTHIIEIGFLPGVTDNVGNTVKELIVDLLSKKILYENKVYTYKIFLINTKANIEEIKIASLSFYNPLIESFRVFEIKKLKENILPIVIPKVILNQDRNIIEVDLNVPDEELIRIGREGIQDKKGIRRGPLALDIESIKVIKEYFKKQKRNPTDIELEALAQT
ncbi:MAG: hypothetical protein QM532_04070 [Cyanobium sp. MAG06]|nr:hypothetical protein [Cyanobium sp. MAG06]